MARTPGTRPKGSGIPAGGTGYGGPAKGVGHRITPADALAVVALSTDPANRAAKATLAAEMLGIMLHVAREGDAEAVRVTAADRVMDRLLGKATQATDITSGGERIGYVIAAPAEASSAAAWQDQHKPR